MPLLPLLPLLPFDESDESDESDWTVGRGTEATGDTVGSEAFFELLPLLPPLPLLPLDEFDESDESGWAVGRGTEATGDTVGIEAFFELLPLLPLLPLFPLLPFDESDESDESDWAVGRGVGGAGLGSLVEAAAGELFDSELLSDFLPFSVLFLTARLEGELAVLTFRLGCISSLDHDCCLRPKRTSPSRCVCVVLPTPRRKAAVGLCHDCRLSDNFAAHIIATKARLQAGSRMSLGSSCRYQSSCDTVGQRLNS